MHRILYAPLALLAAAALTPAARADIITNNTSLASPGLYFGDPGNVNAGFTVSTNADVGGNVELGLSAILRYLGPITPAGDTYTVPVGETTASPHTGSAWGVDFSINLQSGGGSLTLGGIDAVLSVVDNNTGFTQSFVNFLASLPDDTCYGPSGVTTCADPSAFGVQNALPGSLLSVLGDTGFNEWAAGSYDITLSVYGCADAAGGCMTNLLASDTIHVDAVPEPDSAALLGVALLGLGLLWNRRRIGDSRG